MDKHVKNGIISMSIWILFIMILWGSYLYITEKNVSYFLDEETVIYQQKTWNRDRTIRKNIQENLLF